MIFKFSSLKNMPQTSRIKRESHWKTPCLGQKFTFFGTNWTYKYWLLLLLFWPFLSIPFWKTPQCAIRVRKPTICVDVFQSNLTWSGVLCCAVASNLKISTNANLQWCWCSKKSWSSVNFCYLADNDEGIFDGCCLRIINITICMNFRIGSDRIEKHT